MEKFLIEDNSRFTLFPIQYHDIWKSYENHKNAFWTAQEIDFSADLSQWEKLTIQERFFIENILGFFAGSDGIVLENLVSNFCSEIKNPEMRYFYTFQAMMENIHGECYSLLIESLVKDPKRKKILFNAIDTIPCISKKAEWAKKWLDTKNSFAQRIVAFAVVEGVFFSGAFCSIFWLKNRGIMINSLGKANELIARDEGLHTDFAVLMYNNYIEDKLDVETLNSIVKEAVDIEIEFICKSLSCNLIGMNSDLMTSYIKYIADRLVVQLGGEKIYHEKNPFPFMNQLSLDGLSNFFETRVTEYSNASSVVKQSDKHFILSDDF
jgi:ribonucleoside-diphosphate reductase beta chain